jgi:hypothetical protein
MSDPAAAPSTEPAWHPDPWKQAQLRWHDGTDWTGHVHGDAPSAAPAAQQLAAAPVATTPAEATHAELVAEDDWTGEGDLDATRTLPVRLIAIVGAVAIVALLVLFGPEPLRLVGGDAEPTAAAPAADPAAAADPTAVPDATPAELADPADPAATAGDPTEAAPAVDTTTPVPAADPSVVTAQQTKGASTALASTVKQVVNAVEACAAGTTTGVYTGCEAAKLAEFEPALAAALDKCHSPGGACIEVTAPTAYAVTVRGEGDLAAATFVEQHGENGTITKTCSVPAGVETICSGGRWG